MDPAVTPTIDNQHDQGPDDKIWREALDWTIRLNGAQPDAAENAAFTAWLNRGEAHRMAYRRADRVWALTGAAAPRGVLRPAPGERPRLSAGSRSRRVRRLVLGSALLAASILFLVLDRVGILVSADYRTALGETRALRLDDGTVLWLNADSAVAVDYDAAARTVRLLAGEVLVEVARDARPFSLTAADLTVTDIGTVFDVDLQPRALTVSVQDGQVAARYRRGQAESSAELGRNERIRIDRETGAIARDTTDAARVGDWRSGRLVVEAMPIGDVIAELQRYYRGFILVRDADFAARPVSGVFDLKDPLRALRAAVQPYAGEVRTFTPALVTVSGPAEPAE